MPTGFGHAKADVVEHLAKLVQRVEPHRISAFPRAPIVKNEASLDAHTTRQKIDAHVVHADATVTLVPNA